MSAIRSRLDEGDLDWLVESALPPGYQKKQATTSYHPHVLRFPRRLVARFTLPLSFLDLSAKIAVSILDSVG